MHKPVDVGTVYYYDELDEKGSSAVVDTGDLASQGYKLGRSHTPIVELLRGVLWRDKYWCTEKLIKWLDDYQPELVFYNFTNNLFLQKIVLFISDRYGIPIVTAIGDDYYFNDKRSFSLAYHMFRWRYKKLTEEVFSHRGSAVYVCDKIKDKYNERFGLGGETIYFNTEVKRKPFTPIDLVSPKIVYFGNIRLGRNHALKNIADALYRINPQYKLEVYSNEQDESVYRELINHQSVIWGGAIPYSEVVMKISTCDIYVIVESFREIDLNFTRYSLSTKAADGLASGALVFAYGPTDSGIIDYLVKTEAACVCTREEYPEDELKRILADVVLQHSLYSKAEIIAKSNHTLEGSTRKFESIVNRLCAPSSNL